MRILAAADHERARRRMQTRKIAQQLESVALIQNHVENNQIRLLLRAETPSYVCLASLPAHAPSSVSTYQRRETDPCQGQSIDNQNPQFRGRTHKPLFFPLHRLLNNRTQPLQELNAAPL